MNIIFMGTPDFAVASLKALIRDGHEILAVFTQPDRPKGRGKKLAFPPVKEYVLKQNISIPILQPNTLKDEAVTDEIKRLNPDVIAVVAYGKLLPVTVLDIPKYGCINVHGSLLPKYRGAAPIQHSILNGDNITGITTMYMGEGLDTGDIILKAETEIEKNETSDELFMRLSLIGAELLCETMKAIENKSICRIKQDDSEATYAPALTKDMCGIDFTKPSRDVHNKIRALSSWPCAVVLYKERPLKIYRSALADEFAFKGAKPGELLDKKRLIAACGEGAVELLEVQYDGSKRMRGLDFINGQKIKPGDFLCK